MAGDATDVVEAWLTAETPRLLDELFAFLRIPSVSTDPAYAEPHPRRRRPADAPVAPDRHAGGDAAGGRRPSERVRRAWTDAPGTPTILVYGHYDVQPPEPLAEWHSPPFEPTLREGRIFARGACDDKSPLWIALSALEGWLAVHGRLPVNVKLLLEGEEESGSRSPARHHGRRTAIAWRPT